jgi:hypothetical protein
MQDLCQTYASSTHLRFCLGIIITPRHLRKCLGIYENAGITILPLTYTLVWSSCSLLACARFTCYSFHAVCITGNRVGLSASRCSRVCCAQPHLHSDHAPYYNAGLSSPHRRPFRHRALQPWSWIRLRSLDRTSYAADKTICCIFRNIWTFLHLSCTSRETLFDT